MDFKSYQKIIDKTAIYPDRGKTLGLAYVCLGLSGEVGEVNEKVKKHIRDKTPLDNDSLKKELGDVLWYITAIANERGIDLEDIAQTNYNKLIKRRETNTLQGNGDDREDSPVANYNFPKV